MRRFAAALALSCALAAPAGSATLICRCFDARLVCVMRVGGLGGSTGWAWEAIAARAAEVPKRCRVADEPERARETT